MSGNWKGDLHVAKCEDEILTTVMMYGLPGMRFWEISLRKKAKLISKPSEVELASKGSHRPQKSHKTEGLFSKSAYRRLATFGEKACMLPFLEGTYPFH